MNINYLLFLTLIGILVAAASAYIGSIMVLKRMSLVGDALSHVALPGMAIAIAFHFPPLWGAFIALTIAVIGIWYLESKSDVYPEALVGIFFTAALAVGLLLTPEVDLLEALFGNIEKITITEGLLTIGVSAAAIIITALITKKLLLIIISPDLATINGIKTHFINLVYLLLVGIIVAVGIKFVGTLLTGALVIVPAAAAKNISGSFRQYIGFSIILGAIAALVGIPLSISTNLPTGPIVILISVGLFTISSLKRILR